MNNKWKLTLGIVAGLAIAAPISTAYAPLYAQGKFDAAAYRINLAGRQRMLTQQMAKAACFIEIDIEKERHLAMLAEARAVFDTSLHQLRDGGGQPAIAAEDDRRTLEGLKVVFEHWETFKVAVDHVIEIGAVEFETEEIILESNVITLEDMNKTVSLIEQEYANPNQVMMGQAVAINIFGRQRMLSQKATKEFCYVVGDHHAAEEKALLGKTHALFEASLQAIMHGMPAVGIKKPPTQEISDQLQVVYDIWHPMDEIFVRTIAGEKPTHEELLFIATENDHLMSEMNKAVVMYQNLEV